MHWYALVALATVAASSRGAPWLLGLAGGASSSCWAVRLLRLRLYRRLVCAVVIHIWVV